MLKKKYAASILALSITALSAVTVLTATAGPIATTSPANVKETLKIGIAGPFSGPVSPYGQMQLHGAYAAI
ncbi:MAG: hypothetical protein OIF57_14255, partial [Marinobacterium sp.]|nr:hypothetical protein [Marinobacterium sp.]